MSRPNILLIVTDQEYAHQPYPPGFSLPNREKLRQRGISFDNYQVTTTLCTPSRACMYTGQHTPLTGMWDNDNMSYISSLSPDIPTLGHMLREAGYVTAYKGKWHLSQQSYDHTSADEMEPYGFADFQTWGSTFGLQTEGSHLDRRIGQDAADWILENGSVNDQEQPWFLAVNFINPHDIMFYNMGEEHEATMLNMVAAAGTDLYQQEWDVTLPASFGENSEEHPAGVEEFRQVNGRFQGRVPIENTKDWQHHYDAMIEFAKHYHSQQLILS
ncbi:MAG: sulfatase-like hydrolase/transferase, partial [Anaerolineae bacterium]